ncbi:MAG: TlpA family protein disulfide reductase [Rubrobacteraceae bacterium]
MKTTDKKTVEQEQTLHARAGDPYNPYNYDRFSVDLYRLDQLPGPEVGEQAPDFVAEALDGRTVSLSDYRGVPIVLVTGSYTCPQYVDKIDAMDRISQRYPEATFLTIYVREAHPGAEVPPHRHMEEKRALARRTVAEDGEKAEVLLDDLNGTAHRAFGSLPNVVYVIDAGGTVVMRGDWNNPRVVEEALGRIRRGESLGGMWSGFTPGSPLTAARVLRRAGWNALGDFLVALPKLVAHHAAQHLSASRKSPR